MLSQFGFAGILILIGSLLVSMVIHEFMHAFVGYKLGDTTAKDEGRLSLNPLNHIDPVMTVLLPIVTLLLFHTFIAAARPVPFNQSRVKYNEFGAALIAAAGPLSNFLLAVVAAGLLHVVGDHGIMGQILLLFLQLNIVLFIFNLIPIPPLDGSRVLYAFAPEPLQELLERLEPIGFFIIIALVMLGGFGGLLSNLSSIVINWLT